MTSAHAGCKLRIGVLASGEGTTLQAVLDACSSGRLIAEVAIVVSNNPASGALRRALTSSVQAIHLSAATHPVADELDSAILAALRSAAADLLLLAGYVKKVGPKTLAFFAGRALNTHPALLPQYGGKGMYGRRIYEAVLAARETRTGVTVHQVDGEYDHGPIVAQTVVPIIDGDDVESLSARVREVERLFLVQTLQQLASERGSTGLQNR